MPEELDSFNECFICGTGAEVTPVSEIGPYRFTPGNISKTLLEDYTLEVNCTALNAIDLPVLTILNRDLQFWRSRLWLTKR